MHFLCFLLLFYGFNGTSAQEQARRLHVAHPVNSTVDLSCWGLVASLNDSHLTGTSLVPGKLGKGEKRNITTLRCEHAGEMNCDYSDGKGKLVLELSVIMCPPRICPNTEPQQINLGDNVTFIICVLTPTPKVGVPLMVSYKDKWLQQGKCHNRLCADWENRTIFEYTVTLTLMNVTTRDLRPLNIKLGSNYDYYKNYINLMVQSISTNETRFSDVRFMHIILMSVVPSSILIVLTAIVLIVYKNRGGTVKTRNEPTSTSLRGWSWYMRDLLDKRCQDEEHFYQPASHAPRPRDVPLNTRNHRKQIAQQLNSQTYTAPNDDVFNSQTYLAPNDVLNSQTYLAPNDVFNSHNCTAPNDDVFNSQTYLAPNDVFNSHTYTAPNDDVLNSQTYLALNDDVFNSQTYLAPNDVLNSHTYAALNNDVLNSQSYLVPKDVAFISYTYLTPYEKPNDELFYTDTYLPNVGAPSEVFYEHVI